MSIAHLSESPARKPVPARRDAARDRLLALVTQIEGDHLDVAEELLAGIVAHQRSDTRGFTASDLSVLARLGVTEPELTEPSSLRAMTQARVWEQQSAARSATVTETAEMLGVTPARIRQRCASGTLLAQRRSDGWHLPLFQFPDERELRGWATVAQAIPRSTPLLLAERVLTSPAPRLRAEEEEFAPLEWLAQGGDPAAAAAAVDDALNRLP